MRTKGATSFMLVPVSEINRVFQAGALIPISRLFAARNGIVGTSVYSGSESLKGAGNPPAIEEKISVQEITGE